ncbi:MAG: acetoacetate--CoA ligase [Gemmatimonadaceae bacterium]
MDRAPDDGAPIWTPTREQVAAARMTAFLELVQKSEAGVVDYPSLYRWSVERREEFWRLLAGFCGVVAEGVEGRDPWVRAGQGLERMAPPDPVLGPRWFPDARLNFAENLLRFRDDATALVSWNELGRRRALTFAELYAEVARTAAALRAAGVGAGDRVAGYLPNVPQAVIAMLAAASLGAVWSSCSPDFGVKGVLDRFGQIAPRVLFCADGYRYAGKEIDCLQRVREVAAAIASIERVVVVPYLREEPVISTVRQATLWSEFVNGGMRNETRGPGGHRERPEPRSSSLIPPSPHEVIFERLPFDHPLYIMYSSGTTGLPKCMVHGAGGTLLQHLKELVLHTDLGREPIFYFTTCGWMMWNWLVSALAVGATVVLYDGAPLAPRPEILWDMAERERLRVFGTSAKYLALLEKEGVEPARTHDLSALDVVLSTGSPLAAHSYDFVRERVKRDARLSRVSGGTDIIACFAIGNPVAPVWRGELQTRALGMAVEVWDDDGRPLRGAPGELVCTKPFPSMPVAFWNDPDGARYRAAYFEHFPGVWRHGDWAELTEHDGLVIHGRSDATLNPGGVRIGTAEIYRQVEQLPEVVESLVVGQDVGAPPDVDTRIVLFVRLRPGLALDEALRERIRRQIRENTSPHHVPRRVVQVADIPRTISGKITELAVREVIHGRPVKNVDALANPEALALFRDLPELRD